MRPWTERSARGFVLALLAALSVAPADAQVVFDDTFGSPGAAPTDPAGTTFLIEQARGATVSSGGRTHVLHSFEQFGVPLAHTAEFRTADDVDTILSRVTGNGVSLIDGDLRVRNTAGVNGPDLYLMNPNGVIFGGNTRLDMDAALHVTTASFIGFEDGSIFSAVDLNAPLPTTAAAPSVLGFGETGSGDVEIDGRVLSNDVAALDAAVLSIVGRNVSATRAGFIAAEQATVQIGAVGDGALGVPIDLAKLDARGGDSARGAIRIGGGAGEPFTVSTTGPNPDQGRIVIRAGSLTLDEGSLLAGGDGSSPGTAVALDVEVAGEVRIRGTSAKIGSVSGGAFGPGTLRLVADRLDIGGAGSVEITTNGDDANIGRLEIDVSALAIDAAFSEIKSTTTGPGDGGAIEIQANTLEITRSGRVLSETLPGATGSSGKIAATADSLRLESSADILSVTNGAGRAGDIELRGASLLARDFARIVSGSNDLGASGNVDLRFGEVELHESSVIGTGPVSITPPGEEPLGPAGDVYVEADTLLLDGGSQITATTAGDGAAGDVSIVASGALVVRGEREGANQPSGIFARSGLGFGSAASGDAGTITIRAGRVELSDGAEIGAQTFGAGRAGEIDISTGGGLVLLGGRITATATDVGVTGDIRIRAGDALVLGGGAEILSEAPVARADPGSAGSIVIQAARLIRIEDSSIATNSARPDTGDIRLEAGSAIGLVASSVTTNVDAPSGRGGNVELEAGAIALERSVVTANAEGTNADAGNVLLSARDGILRSPDSRVEARAELGVSGEVVFAAPETNVTAELGVVSADYLDPDEQLTNPCRARASRAGSFSVQPMPAPTWSPERPLPVDEGGGGAGRADDCAAP